MFRKSDIGKTYEDASNFAYEHQWDLFNEWKRVTKKGRYSESYLLSDYRESIRNGIKHKTYDFHFVDPRLTDSGVTDVAFYVLKYMMKGDGLANEHERKIYSALKLNLDKEEFEEVWKLIHSRKRQSLYFGLDIWEEDKKDYTIVEWLRQGIERSKQTSKYPLYYCPEQLMTFPLCPYYKENALIYDVKDTLDFYYSNDRWDGQVDSYYELNKTVQDHIKKMTDYERKLKIIKEDCFSQTLEELYND